MALAYDPIGQGERLQYYAADQQKSFIGNPTGEHGEANIGPMLIGDNIARYMVNDAMRGVDYLVSRKDVDATRIGAFGCSGGGTSTAYFAALDDRVKGGGVGVLHHIVQRTARIDNRSAGCRTIDSTLHRTGFGFRGLGRSLRSKAVRRHFDDGRHVSVRRRAPDGGRGEAVLFRRMGRKTRSNGSPAPAGTGHCWFLRQS